RRERARRSGSGGGARAGGLHARVAARRQLRPRQGELPHLAVRDRPQRDHRPEAPPVGPARARHSPRQRGGARRRRRLVRARPPALAGRRGARAAHARAPAGHSPRPFPGPHPPRDIRTHRHPARHHQEPHVVRPPRPPARARGDGGGGMTAACNECRTLLGGYVLHALEPDEAEAVRRHLAECAACAAEHGQLMSIPPILDAAGEDETPAERPPAALEEAVLDRFAREHPGHPGEPAPRKRVRERLRTALRPLTRPLPAALAGAVAAAAVTAAIIVLPGSSHTDGELYQASLAGSPAAPGAIASARL